LLNILVGKGFNIEKELGDGRGAFRRGMLVLGDEI
jgi:hypothetical protein